jgi:hypothetical protein
MRKVKFVLLIVLGFTFVSCGNNCKFNDISTTSLPNGKVGQAYTARIEHNSTCTPTYKECDITTGSLPPGLNMNIADGEITGTPTSSGSYKFTVDYKVCFGTGTASATDCTDKTKEFTINIGE